MKKLLVLAGAVACMLSLGVKASNADLFQVDETGVKQKLNGLNQLENYVNKHEGVTLSDLKANHSEMLANVEDSDAQGILGTLSAFGDTPLGIPAFVWGLCLGWVGIVIVYFVTDDKEETKKALWGCLLGSAIYAIFYVIYVVLIVASAASTTTTY